MECGAVTPFVMLIFRLLDDGYQAMKEYRLRLQISAQKMLAYYNGEARYVLATARDGTRVQMPAYLLRAHMTGTGVDGEFCLRCDDNHRFVSLSRMGS